jgi:hypothetical protein
LAKSVNAQLRRSEGQQGFIDPGAPEGQTIAASLVTFEVWSSDGGFGNFRAYRRGGE